MITTGVDARTSVSPGGTVPCQPGATTIQEPARPPVARVPM